jgi:hypothetical protein
MGDDFLNVGVFLMSYAVSCKQQDEGSKEQGASNKQQVANAARSK